MAKKPQPVDNHSESSEEDDSSSEQESDPEPALTQVSKKPTSSTPAAAKKPKSQSVSKPPPKAHVEEQSESESESETESESDSGGPDPKPSSIATKPKEVQEKASVKRPAEEMATVAKDLRKTKKKKADPEMSEIKPTSERSGNNQRLFSEDDEIAILQGMIDYHAKNNTNPLSDLTAFHDFIKGNLQIVVTDAQLQDKIRRLKKKYENNKSKEKKAGKSKTSPKAHEQKSYELSKSIWDKENVKDKRVEKVVGKAESFAVGKAESFAVGKAVDVRAESIAATVDKRIMMIGDDKFEGDEEWNKLKIEEMEMYLGYMELKTKQARFVYKRLKAEFMA